MVISFKEEVEKQYFNEQKLNKRVKNAKQRLDNLVRKLIYRLRNSVVHDKRAKEATFLKDGGQKWYALFLHN